MKFIIKQSKTRINLTIIYLSLLSFCNCYAQTSIVVNSLADDGSSGTLRWAINQANATSGGIYDEITFNVTGTIVLTSSLPTITQSLTITGPGQNSLLIDGNNLYRSFYSLTALTVNISDITLKKGNAVSGGIIYNKYATYTFTNVKICEMTSGSAIFQDTEGVMTFSNCLFTGLNIGTDSDWGLPPTTMSTNDLVYTNRMYFNSCTFTNNIYGIKNFRFTKITNCTFTNNTVCGAKLQGLNRYQVYSSTFTGNGTGVETYVSIPTTYSMGSENQLIENNAFLNNTIAINLGNLWSNGTTNNNGVSSNSTATIRTNCFTGNGTDISGVAGYTSTGNSFGSLAAITGSSSVCLGSTITLVNATSGGTWSSSNTAIATVNSSGIVTPIAAGNVNISYSLTGSCASASVSKTITVNAPSFSTTLATGNYVWLGTTSTDWSTLTNWRQYNGTALDVATSVPSSTDLTIIPPNGTCVLNQPVITSGVMSSLSVIVETGAVFNMGAGTLEVSGDITNNGTINPTTGTLKLMGGNTATIAGSGTFNFNNLTIEKTSNASINLSVPITIKGVLTMTSGNIFNPSALLTLGSSSASPGSLTYTSGTILGKMKRYFSASATTTTGGLFPVGTATYNRFAKVYFTSSPGTNQFLTVEYKTGAPLNASNTPLYAGLPTTIAGQLVQVYSADGYWQIDPTDNNYASTICTTPYNLTLNANNLTNFNNPSTVRIIKAAGSNTLANHHVSWQGAGTHTPNATTNATVAEISSTNCTGFSWFNIGTWNDQALPVELTSFSSECKESGVDINWQTASEHNSELFTVEKSRDGENWQQLSTQTAAGTSTSLQNYSYTDNEKNGLSYYRLQQIDQDGNQKMYGPISANCEFGGLSVLTYPNPSSDYVNVMIESDKAIEATIVLKDQLGRLVYEATRTIERGTTQLVLNDVQLAPGVYTFALAENQLELQASKHIVR